MGMSATRIALRTLAIAIAIASVIDPVMTVSTASPAVVVVARLASSDVTAIEAALRSALPNTELIARPVSRGRLPCAPGERCVMLVDGSVDAEIPEDVSGPVSLVQAAVATVPNVVVRSVAASLTQNAAGSGIVSVELTGVGMQGRRTDLRVMDGAATVGSAVHEWQADGDATIDIAWWSLAEGPRALTTVAVPFQGEASALDNAVDVGVAVSSGRVAVLVFDPRPSWASTFVRRALEDDPRFQVDHRVAIGPSLAAGTAGGRLDARTLDAVPVAMVGSPEGLSSSDVTLLERFVRERGGTLILLPDRALFGAATRLFSGRWTEHLEASASPAGVLRASETLRLSAASPFDLVLGAVKGSPVIVLSPTGHGRIVVSGAMDAWRYRDTDGGVFDRFWRSLVLESAAASASLRLEFEQPIAAPDTDLPFVIRHRRMDPSASSTITATAACGNRAAQVVRVWPEGDAGVFAGTVSIEGSEPCHLRVTVNDGPTAVGGVAVTTGATRSVSAVRSKLVRSALRTGGGVALAGEERKVAAALMAGMPERARRAPVHPMRSPWWMFPFVTCLGVEWWLRRRSGLR